MSDRDPGLQPERTRLAWRRTVLSATVATVLAGKAVIGDGVPPAGAAVFGTVSVAAWVGLLILGGLRTRALESPGAAAPPPLPPVYAAATALCTLALAVCAAAVLI